MRPFRLVVLLLALLASVASASVPDDGGYFLSWSQKGQLIWSGCIRDAEGTSYDVWIVPGYAPPGQRAGRYAVRAATDLGEYVHARKYRDLGHDSRDGFRWAYKDCFWTFTIKGIPRAWRTHFDAAGERSRRRVFGWWLAYPWATFESLVDNVVRLPVGVAGTALGTAYAGVGVPAYYTVNSTVKAAWHLGVDAAVIPAAGIAWNTAIAPPMALVGQRPAPSRVDGFWVRATPRAEQERQARLGEPLSDADIDAVAAWARTLESACQPCRTRQQEATRKREEAQRQFKDALRAYEESTAEVRREEDTCAQAARGTADWKPRLRELAERHVSAERMAQHRARIIERMAASGAPVDTNAVWALLMRYPPDAGARSAAPRPKADPLTHGVEEGAKTIDMLP